MHLTSFSLLFVCTANLCRSPTAEFLARQQMATVLPAEQWSIRSAGVRARAGEPVHPRSAEELLRRGVDVAGFRSTQLTPELIGQADIVLTAERVHRSAVVRTDPRAAGRTFTLLQFAELCRSVPSLKVAPGTAGPALLSAALHQRGRKLDDGPTDIEDPIGRRRRRYRLCADTIENALNTIWAPLSPTGP